MRLLVLLLVVMMLLLLDSRVEIFSLIAFTFDAMRGIVSMSTQDSD